VGAASRDVVEDDRRGWRLGGGVSYSALAVARLGLPTRAVIGVDREASTAPELDLLRQAGVDVHLVPLERGPVFVNIERPEGRLQLCHSPSDPVPTEAVPDEWRDAMQWIGHQPKDVHVLADPAHARRFGSSVRVAAARDVYLEDVKDAAIAMYSRDMAMRVLGRTRDLGEFSALTRERALELARNYDLDYLLAERAIDLPLAYKNARFRVYHLR